MPEEGGGFKVSTSRGLPGRQRGGRQLVPTGELPHSPQAYRRISFRYNSAYRSPGALPPGAVLVVGPGSLGAQIAEELYLSGRRVFLATGTAPHAPRRYRGKTSFVGSSTAAWLTGRSNSSRSTGTRLWHP